MEHAPEGKDPDGPVGGGGGKSGDVAEPTATTNERCDTLRAMMKDASFDINTTGCGRYNECALFFALGGEGEPIDEEAVKLVLFVLDLSAGSCGARRGH